MSAHKSRMLVSVLATVCAGSALAAVSAEEARQLGGPVLTEWGAERAGNKEGTIPAYTGEEIRIPASFDAKNPGMRPDPFDDKPLFSITAQNHAQYKDRLSDGQKEMFKLYPKFRMDVYPTHRTARYPDFFKKNSVKNATECGTTDEELKLSGCRAGTPFPIPKTGAQMMWNHLLQYQSSGALQGDTGSYLSTATGKPLLQAKLNIVEQFAIYGAARQGAISPTDQYFATRVDYSGPPRAVGQILVILDSVDNVRRAWQYLPGQRRVKLAPDLAYDTPNPVTGGSANMDDAILFFGSLDRWEFKLAGKKEAFIIYNAFKSQEPLCPVDKLMTPGHLNPDCVRWELHRVWVVNATLKPGFRHNYARRVFHFDEDIPGAGMADNYDAAGRLYRISDVLPFPLYEVQSTPAQGQLVTVYTTNDLARGSYSIAGTSIGQGWRAVAAKDPKYYSPEMLAGEGIR